MSGDCTGECGFSATRWPWEEDEAWAVVFGLVGLVGEVGSGGGLVGGVGVFVVGVEREWLAECLYSRCRRGDHRHLPTKHHPIPALQPRQHISIMHLLRQQLIKSLRLILFRPLRPPNHLLPINNNLILPLLNMIKILKRLHIRPILLPTTNTIQLKLLNILNL